MPKKKDIDRAFWAEIVLKLFVIGFGVYVFNTDRNLGSFIILIGVLLLLLRK